MMVLKREIVMDIIFSPELAVVVEVPFVVPSFLEDLFALVVKWS